MVVALKGSLNSAPTVLNATAMPKSATPVRTEFGNAFSNRDLDTHLGRSDVLTLRAPCSLAAPSTNPPGLFRGIKGP